jgi:hypothetical protein
MPTVNRTTPAISQGNGFKVLRAATCRCGLPAGRAWPGSLQPGDVDQENADTAEKTEGRAANRRPRRHPATNNGNRSEHEHAQRHEAHRRRTTKKRPGPEPAAADDVSAKHQSGSRRLSSFLASTTSMPGCHCESV